MKPSIPKGTRDFSPEEVRKRNYLFGTIREVFVRYGYQPIETPSMEDLATLTGKYGEEGDRLLFKVLNNGDFLAKADEAALTARDSNALAPSIAKRGLRYDLTVPFARYVVMHQNEITFPFKRYQIQPVWRADRPQRGRYQEFYQCDVDVVGSSSLVYEAELAQIYDEVFARLDLDVVIKINNRKVLAGIAETAGIPDRMADMTVAIDKLDKVGPDGVREEMRRRGIPEAAITNIEDILSGGSSLDSLEKIFADSDTGKAGVSELRAFHRYFDTYAPKNKVIFDITLARGLDYYTGCIFEVGLNPDSYPALRMGSIGGGGRYDNLTGVFGLGGVSGVGVSFGAERIYDVMEELGLFPEADATRLQVVFLAFDEATHLYAFRCLNRLRAAGINAEIYPEPAKIGKQMKYADSRNAPYAVIVGEEEMKTDLLTVKDMYTGEQQKIESKELDEFFKGSKVGKPRGIYDLEFTSTIYQIQLSAPEPQFIHEQLNIILEQTCQLTTGKEEIQACMILPAVRLKDKKAMPELEKLQVERSVPEETIIEKSTMQTLVAPPSTTVKPKTRRRSLGYDVHAIVSAVKASEYSELFQKEILAKSNQLNRILLGIYYSDQVFPKRGLTTGDIEAITEALDSGIRSTNISSKIKKNKKLFRRHDTRKRGSVAHYSLTKKGRKEFEKLLK